MIAIISSSAHERVAFAALCESRRWACLECDSVHAVRKALQQFRHLGFDFECRESLRAGLLAALDFNVVQDPVTLKENG